MADLSRALLEAFLKDRASRTGMLVGAIYEGLLTRMRRGEFDEEAQS